MYPIAPIPVRIYPVRILDVVAALACGIDQPALSVLLTLDSLFVDSFLTMSSSFIRNSTRQCIRHRSGDHAFHYKDNAVAMFLLTCRTEGPEYQNFSVSTKTLLHLPEL